MDASPPGPGKGRLPYLIGGAGLLAVVAFFLLLPWLLSALRGPGAERPWVSAIKTLATAEADYKSNDRDGNGVLDYWVGDVSRLHYLEPKGGEKIRLIEKSVADADAAPRGATDKRPKSGYWYAVVPLDPDGKPYADADGRNAAGFAFCTYPDRYPASGKFTFLVNEEGTLWKKDTGGAAVKQYPKDPVAEGWAKLD